MKPVLGWRGRLQKRRQRLIPQLGEPTTLKGNVSWIAAGNAFFAACQWAILVVIAKLGNSSMVGQYVLALAITAPIMLLANLKLRTVIATDARRSYVFSEYVSLRVLTSLLALAVIFGIIAIGSYGRDVTLTIMIIALAKALDSVGDILNGYLQKHEQLPRIAVSRVLVGTGQLLLLTLLIALTGNVVWGALGLVLASGAVLLTYDVPNARQLRELLRGRNHLAASEQAGNRKTQWSQLKLHRLGRLAAISLPLGLAVMLGSLWMNIPRYIIEHFHGERELGLFAAIASLTVVGSTLVGALSQSSSPRLARYHAAGDSASFDRLVRRLVLSGALIGLVGLLIAQFAGRTLLTLLYGAEYASNSGVLVWVMAAFALQFVYVFAGTGIQAMRKFHIHLPIQLCGCLIILVLSYFLVDRYGLYGAAWALLGAGLFAAIAYSGAFLYVRRAARKNDREYLSHNVEPVGLVD